MGYRLERDESVRDAVRRIAREQTEKALGEIGDDDLGLQETVHQVRKRCKKVRGVLRLVRPALGDHYSAENKAYRDAARRVSALRDAYSLLEVLDDLEGQARPAGREAIAAVRPAFAGAATRVADEAEWEDRLGKVADDLEDALGRSDSWRLSEDGAAALEGGLRKTYRRGRRALAAASERPTLQRLHEWRKRVKYHGYHLRAIVPAGQSVVEAERSAAERLSDVLGDEHDLRRLQVALAEEHAAAEPAALHALVLERRASLLREARTLGRRLYAERPKPRARRLVGYVRAWHAEENEPTFRSAPRPSLARAS